MKKLLYLLPCLALIFSCSSDNNTQTQVVTQSEKKELPRDEYVAEINKLEKAMFESEAVVPEIADKAIKAYSDYALLFPDDTITPHYIFKAAEVATANKLYDKAIIYYENIEKQYPKFVHLAAAVYMQAYIFDYLLNDDKRAEVVYQRVINNYPATVYATNAKEAILLLGKTDEEIIKEFKKKNGQK